MPISRANAKVGSPDKRRPRVSSAQPGIGANSNDFRRILVTEWVSIRSSTRVAVVRLWRGVIQRDGARCKVDPVPEAAGVGREATLVGLDTPGSGRFAFDPHLPTRRRGARGMGNGVVPTPVDCDRSPLRSL